MEIISETLCVARKEYDCNSCEWLTADFFWRQEKRFFTFDELKEIVKAKQAHWKIQKGQIYRRVTLKDNGELFVFRAIPAIDSICSKYEFYEE